MESPLLGTWIKFCDYYTDGVEKMDRLERIKKSVGGPFYDADVLWLIDELERITGNGNLVLKKAKSLLAEKRKLKAKIESLQLEIAELKLMCGNHEKNRWDNFGLAQERRLKIEELEAILKERDNA